LLYLKRVKKLDTASKTDRVAGAALKFDITFDTITYDEGLKLMGRCATPTRTGRVTLAPTVKTTRRVVPTNLVGVPAPLLRARPSTHPQPLHIAGASETTRLVRAARRSARRGPAVFATT
jgi:hypothetical protein